MLRTSADVALGGRESALNACSRALGTCIHSVVATEGGEEKSHDPSYSHSPHILPRTLRRAIMSDMQRYCSSRNSCICMERNE